MKVDGSGAEHHVDFFAAYEAVDRTAVEGDLAVERVVELLDRNRHALLDAEHVDERETHPAHAAFLRRCQYRAACGRAIFHRRQHALRVESVDG